MNKIKEKAPNENNCLPKKVKPIKAEELRSCKQEADLIECTTEIVDARYLNREALTELRIEPKENNDKIEFVEDPELASKECPKEGDFTTADSVDSTTGFEAVASRYAHELSQLASAYKQLKAEYLLLARKFIQLKNGSQEGAQRERFDSDLCSTFCSI